MNTRTLDPAVHPTPNGKGKLIQVTFEWSDEHGTCEDCGLPAAFRAERRPVCAVCAANAAAEGDRVTRIYE
jgi:hypothetical protein